VEPNFSTEELPIIPRERRKPRSPKVSSKRNFAPKKKVKFVNKKPSKRRKVQRSVPKAIQDPPKEEISYFSEDPHLELIPQIEVIEANNLEAQPDNNGAFELHHPTSELDISGPVGNQPDSISEPIELANDSYNEEETKPQVSTLSLHYLCCDACGFSTRSETALQRHRVGSNCNPLRPFKFKCDICGLTRKTEEVIELHKSSEHAISKFKCDYCRRGFLSKEVLAKHVRTQHIAEGIPCRHCSLRFDSEWKLDTHLRESHNRDGSPKFLCEVCNFSFGKDWILDLHNFYVHNSDSSEEDGNSFEESIDVEH
jgi:hypothetical protein